MMYLLLGAAIVGTILIPIGCAGAGFLMAHPRSGQTVGLLVGFLTIGASLGFVSLEKTWFFRQCLKQHSQNICDRSYQAVGAEK